MKYEEIKENLLMLGWLVVLENVKYIFRQNSKIRRQNWLGKHAFLQIPQMISHTMCGVCLSTYAL
jgi:hypothetical protein